MHEPTTCHWRRVAAEHAERRRQDALAHPAVQEALAAARHQGRREGWAQGVEAMREAAVALAWERSLGRTDHFDLSIPAQAEAKHHFEGAFSMAECLMERIRVEPVEFWAEPRIHVQMMRRALPLPEVPRA